MAAAGIPAEAASTTTRPDIATGEGACYDGIVRDEWVDANGHMNLAYYLVLFDAATDVLFDQIGLGAAHRETGGAALFAVESHVLYRRELTAGQRVRITARALGVDAKRLHVAHEMVEGGACVAMQEILFVYVDLASRRVAPIPAHRVQAIRISPAPPWAGRRISL